MSAVSSETPVSNYLWSNAGFTWGSSTAAKTWLKATISNWDMTADEVVAIAEALTRDSELNFSEALNVVEGYTRQVTFVRNIIESINFVETYTDFINFMVNIVESFTMSDSIAKTIDMGAFMETLAFSEDIAKDFGLNRSETLNVAEAEAHTVQFSRNFNEALSVLDEISKHSVKKLTEAFGVADDDPAKTIGKNISENFAFAEVLTRTVAFVRAYNEGLSMTDAVSKAVGLNKEETFAILEEYRRNANAVMSDVRLANGLDLTEDEFVDLITRASATGYSDFARLMMGDYEYQDAIIKVAMSSINSDRPSVRRLQAEVDLPDIVDRGSATIPVNGTTISFNRTYNDPPEVSVSIKSGTVIARPVVTSITATGFTVELFDASDTSVSGTITWSSIGY